MSRRTLLLVLAAAGLVAVLVVGLSQTGTDNAAPKPSTVSAAEARRALAGAPPELAALHAQAGELIEADPSDVRRRLRELRGRPVVVNKWASWCGPCRFEFPFFQRVSVDYGKRVAFLGLNSRDNREEAERFAARFPVSFPHYEDPEERIARALKAGAYYPTTVFYDAAGKLVTTHQGNYKSEQALRDAVERYALGQR